MPAGRQNAQQRSSSRLGRALKRAFMQAHIALYRLSGGVLGRRFGRQSFLLLTTTGRKSGRERVTPLFYLPEGNDFMLIASNWGEATDPNWWQNLQAHPQAQVQVGQRNLTVSARQVGPEERARLWPFITARYPNFANYQRGITREIPVVLLTPT